MIHLKKLKNAIQTTDTSDSIKKAHHNTKFGEIGKKILDHNHDKYVATQEYKKLATENFSERSKQTDLASKNNIAEFLKNRFWWKTENKGDDLSEKLN